MNISIFGLGYVGCVGVGCLAEIGHTVVGVDISEKKVELINAGEATIVEDKIDDILKKNVGRDLISATISTKNAIMESEVAIICVGTPNNKHGHLDMYYIETVAKEIGEALRKKNTFYTIAIRSTVTPGTNKLVSKIIETVSGKKPNIDFGIVSNPEFLREGTAVDDFFNPPYTVIASESEKALKIMQDVYNGLKGEILVVDISSAELIKFLNNSYHALKVAFGNEIGRLCKKINVDSKKLMRLFVKDTILNISPYYFKPGFAYGGSCLSKDLKALNTIAHDNYIDLPILSSIDASNKQHIDFALELILKKNMKKIGFFNISFKSGTDDLRFSPALELVESLLGKGFKINIYDQNVNLSKLIGSNKEFLYQKLPHISRILYDNFDEWLIESELIVISTKGTGIEKIIRSGLPIIDLVGIKENISSKLEYEGIAW